LTSLWRSQPSCYNPIFSNAALAISGHDLLIEQFITKSFESLLVYPIHHYQHHYETKKFVIPMLWEYQSLLPSFFPKNPTLFYQKTLISRLD
jgi:hypothetical protein